MVLHQAAEKSGLAEQMQRKWRRGKAVDTVPQHKRVLAGLVPGGQCTAAPWPLPLLALHV